MTRIFAFIAALVFAGSVNAQQYPDRTDPNLNDFADMIDAETEARIDAKLAAIAADHQTEVAIVTLSSLRFYAQDSTIEDYSTELFNRWGLGDADANDGILLLIFRDDGEARLEIGSGYNDTAKEAVANVMVQDIVPHFRDGNFSAGIESGVDGLLTRVINPAPANAQPGGSDAAAGSGNTLYYILGAIGVAIAGIFGLNRRNAAKFAAQPCSNCGKTGLQKSREILREATLGEEGAGETRISCPSCGHVDAKPFTVAKLQPDTPKGGGQSKGDGASGKW